MQVVILAGGKGMRLRPLTCRVPKPLIPVAGKPFLQHLVECLGQQGFREVLLLVSYLGEMIEEHFGDGSRLGLSMKYSYEKEPMGTGGAISNASALLKYPFLLLNGDTFLPIDFSRFAAKYRESGKAAMMAVYSNPHKEFRNNIQVVEDEIIKDYSKADEMNKNGVDAGAYILSRLVVEMIPKGRIISLEKEIFPRLITMRELTAYWVQHGFYDMGTIEGLNIVEKILR